jgi:protein-disulfide isomerase
MIMNRRSVVVGLLAVGGLSLAGSTTARAQATDQWYNITGDDGQPVSNMRLPVELTSQIDELEGVVWVGSKTTHRTLVEFFDYNCPFCRRAVKDIHGLMLANPELRVGLVNNAILSPKSEEAAKVELALLLSKGPETAYEFHQKLFERRGTIDGAKALEVSSEFGVPREELETMAGGARIAEMLQAQMSLAASLGFSATPSFSIAGAGVFGYPGPSTLSRIMGSVEQCDEVVC